MLTQDLLYVPKLSLREEDISENQPPFQFGWGLEIFFCNPAPGNLSWQHCFD